jgi:paraquat-inducible protein B
MRKELLIGLFSLIAIILFIGGVLWIKGKDIWGRERIIRAKFTDATGIQPGVYVYFRGVKVGEVKRVKIIPYGVMVEFSVQKEISIPSDSKVYAESRGLFEDKILFLVPGLSSQTLGKDMVLEGIRKENILENLGRMDVKEVITALDELRNFAQTGEKTLKEAEIFLKDLRKKLERIETTATSQMESTGKALKELNLTLKELSEDFKGGALGHLISDTLFYQNLLKTLIRLDSVLERFQRDKGIRVKLF